MPNRTECLEELAHRCPLRPQTDMEELADRCPEVPGVLSLAV